MKLAELLVEYEAAREYTHRLTADLDQATMTWRPHANSSAIGWHLGHTAAVNHYMVRNLTSAEPRIDADLDLLFDSATEEPDRGSLPPTEQTLVYRDAVAASTRRVITMIDSGAVGAPEQLALIARGMLTSIINHEYQHAKWIAEVRESLDQPPVAPTSSSRAVVVDGYWIVETPGDRSGT
jgi:hypothetical protein